MKPPDWVIEDIKSMRAIASRSPAQDAYLSLLSWFTRMIKESKKEI